MDLFNLEDLLEIEREVLSILPPQKYDSHTYFKEPVAQYLYSQWLIDRTDNRVLIYILPLIQSIMVQKRNIIKQNDKADLFQSIFLSIASLLEAGKYQEERGRLYTFLTLKIHYRILDYHSAKKKKGNGIIFYELLESDASDTYECQHLLFDLLSYLDKLYATEGFTSKRILKSFISAITSSTLNWQKQDEIIAYIAKEVKLPIEIVRLFYLKTIKSYQDISK